MPFLAQEHIDIPNKDILSWMFDGQTYDPDAPVSQPFMPKTETRNPACAALRQLLRYTLTPLSLRARYAHAKRKSRYGHYALASKLLACRREIVCACCHSTMCVQASHVLASFTPRLGSTNRCQIYYSVAFLGILAFGGIFAGSNPSHTPYELAHAFKIPQVKALIVEPELLPNALKAAKECGVPQSRIFVFDHHTPVSVAYDKREGQGEGLGGEHKWGGLKSWERWGMDT